MAEASPAGTSGLVRGLHLHALWSLAVAGPLLDVLGRAEPFFVARDARASDVIVLLSAVFVIAPALLLAVVAGGAALAPRLGVVLQRGLLTGLTALLVAPVLSRVGTLPGEVCVALGLGAGLGLLAALRAARPLREVLAWTALAPLLFIAVFVSRPGVWAVWQTARIPAREDAVALERPVVLLVLDELPLASLLSRPGVLDAGLFPHVARLAGTSTWYADATSVHESTTGAVPALLTGARPAAGRLPILAHHPRNVFTWLGGGPPVHVLESVTALCPPDRKRAGRAAETPAATRWAGLLADAGLVAAHAVLPADLATGLPSVRDDWGDFWRTFESPRLRAAALTRWIDGIDGPGLHVAHVLLPHLPWFFLPDGRQYASPDAVRDPHEFARWSAWEFGSDQAFQRHLLQLGHVDALLGRLIDGLQAKGLWDDALVVLVADHGASFEPGQPRREVTPDTLSDIARVPLFLKAPGQREPRVSARNVESIDLLPLMAEALGRSLPWPVDGVGEAAPARADKSIARQVGDALTMAAEGPLHDPLLARRMGRFGTAPDWAAVFALGRGQGLLDVPLASLPSAPPALGRVVLGGSGPELSVPPDAAVLPAFVAGRVQPAEGQGLPPHVALAVDDVVASVVPVDGEGGFSALLDPRHLTPGAHRLTALSLGQDGRLAPFASSRAHLSRRADGSPEFVTAEGRRLPLDPELVVGVVDEAVNLQAAVRLSGWALDRRGPRAPGAVVVLAGGRAVAEAPLDRVRDLSSREPGIDPSLRAGFRLELSAADLPPGDVRVIAVSGDRAAELAWGASARWIGERVHRMVPGEAPHLVDRQGRRVPLGAPHLRGVVDVAQLDAEHLLLLGWAVDTEASREAEELLVLVDGEQVFSGHQWLPREELAATLGDPGLGRAGFRYELPRAWLPDDPGGRVRVMARSRGAAAELAYAPDAAWLRPGAKVVTVGDGAGATSWAWDADGDALVSAAGDVRGRVGHRLSGAVDRAVDEDGSLRVVGWAVAPPDAADDGIALLIDGVAAFVGATWVPRPDVAAELGLAPEAPVGFELVIPAERFGGRAADGRVALLALSRGQAQELDWRGDGARYASAPGSGGPAPTPRWRLTGDGVESVTGTLRPWLDPRPRGQVDLASRGDGRLTLLGWAADPAGGPGPAWTVLVFEDGALRAQAPVGDRREDVVALHDRSDLRHAGFVIDVTSTGEPAGHGTLATRLRVVAVSPDGAVELPFESR